MAIVAAIAGLVLGALLVWLYCRGQLVVLASASKELKAAAESAEARNIELTASNRDLSDQNAGLATSLSEKTAGFEQRIAELRQNEAMLKDSFARLAQQALEGNNRSFLELAESKLNEIRQGAKGDLDLRKQQVEALVKPINETLARFDQTVKEIEAKRNTAYGDISAQLRNVVEAEHQLRGKAEELASALKGQSRLTGDWGQLQLRQVVESAGLSSYCDFDEQLSVKDSEGRQQYLDLVIRMPNGQRIIVDAKAPIRLFMDAVNEGDETLRNQRLEEFVKGVKKHRQELASKKYWESVEGSPELVVMFLPLESCFRTAIEADRERTLLEFSLDRPVVVASPITLIALLRVVAYGWKQQDVSDNARLIRQTAAELCDRLYTFLSHLQEAGDGLGRAVHKYNEAVGSMERSVLPQARQVAKLGASGSKAIPEQLLTGVTRRRLDEVPRAISAPELVIDVNEASA